MVGTGLRPLREQVKLAKKTRLRVGLAVRLNLRLNEIHAGA